MDLQVIFKQQCFKILFRIDTTSYDDCQLNKKYPLSFLSPLTMNEGDSLYVPGEMGRGAREPPPTGSLYPRESYVCFFIFLVELAAVRWIKTVILFISHLKIQFLRI